MARQLRVVLDEQVEVALFVLSRVPWFLCSSEYLLSVNVGRDNSNLTCHNLDIKDSQTEQVFSCKSKVLNSSKEI